MDATPDPESPFAAPEGLEVVAVFEDYAHANEAGLVILAMGNAYWTLFHGGCYYVCVPAAKAVAVEAELRACAALKGRRRQTKTLRYHDFSFGWRSFVLYAFVLIGSFIGQYYWPITEVGRSDAVAMMAQGAWWRAVTALTLHADSVHLLSNLVSGLGFAFFVCRFFGAASGWALILLSGIAGNLLNAAVYYPDAHYSIGASTAVFGALGILTGVGGWAALSQPTQRMMLPRWLVPIFAGLTLLGLLGMGEGNVDVAAHISGFLCGMILGFVSAFGQRFFIKLEGKSFWIGATTLAVVALAWTWGQLVSG